MKINWEKRLRSKTFWVSLVAMIIVLANQVAQVFNFDIVIHSVEITEMTETVLMILALIGIINEPKGKDDEL